MILIHPKIFGHFGMMPIDSPYSPWCSEVQHLHRFQPNLWGLKFCQDGSKSLGDPPSGPFYGGASLLDLARIRKWIAMEPQYSGLLILVEEDHYTQHVYDSTLSIVVKLLISVESSVFGANHFEAYPHESQYVNQMASGSPLEKDQYCQYMSIPNCRWTCNLTNHGLVIDWLENNGRIISAIAFVTCTTQDILVAKIRLRGESSQSTKRSHAQLTFKMKNGESRLPAQHSNIHQGSLSMYVYHQVQMFPVGFPWSSTSDSCSYLCAWLKPQFTQFTHLSTRFHFLGA